MKLFEFQIDKGLTRNYHSGGGVVILAVDEDTAWEMLATAAEGTLDSTVTVKVHEVTEPIVLVFPDAGCG